MHAWLFVSFVSVWPCDGLATCPGVPRLSPDDRWDRLQPPHDPTNGLGGYRRWMDGERTASYRLITAFTSHSRFTLFFI